MYLNELARPQKSPITKPKKQVMERSLAKYQIGQNNRYQSLYLQVKPVSVGNNSYLAGGVKVFAKDTSWKHITPKG